VKIRENRRWIRELKETLKGAQYITKKSTRTKNEDNNEIKKNMSLRARANKTQVMKDKNYSPKGK